jgi:leucyl aminopeptidase
MPSGKATKPGDVVTARNGKTIQVDNTDAEGRLILADALCLAAESPNRVILDMATLTGTRSQIINNTGACNDLITIYRRHDCLLGKCSHWSVLKQH